MIDMEASDDNTKVSFKTHAFLTDVALVLFDKKLRQQKDSGQKETKRRGPKEDSQSGG